MKIHPMLLPPDANGSLKSMGPIKPPNGIGRSPNPVPFLSTELYPLSLLLNDMFTRYIDII